MPSAARNSCFATPWLFSRIASGGPGDRGHGVQHAKARAEHEPRRPLRSNGTSPTGCLHENQRKQDGERPELEPLRADRRHDESPHDHAWREADHNRKDTSPDRRDGTPVHPQHVRVQDHLDQYQRRVEHAVGHEEERDRNGDRGEAVPQRAVDDGGAERQRDERDVLGRNGTSGGSVMCRARAPAVKPPGRVERHARGSRITHRPPV